MPRNALIAASLAVATLVTLSRQAFATTPVLPNIGSANFSPDGSSTYKVSLRGRHFGVAPAMVPCNMCSLPELFYSGVNGLHGPLNVLAWSDTQVDLSGVPASAGQGVWFGLINDSAQTSGTWGGTVPGGASTRPVIKKVALSGAGANLQMVITGHGFGASPSGIPGTGRQASFIFIDFTAANNNTPWAAGSTLDSVPLNYVSWSDTQVVVNGFGPGYGNPTYGWFANPNDAVLVGLTNTSVSLPANVFQTFKKSRNP